MSDEIRKELRRCSVCGWYERPGDKNFSEHACNEYDLEAEQEYCPVCRRLNCPGAIDVCDHYYGNFWDGEIIWSDYHEEFVEAFYSLSQVVARSMDLKTRLDSESIDFDIEYTEYDLDLDLFDPNSASPEEALYALLDTFEGPYRETDGMASGAGWTIYVGDIEQISKTIAFIIKVKDSIELKLALLEAKESRFLH